MQMGGTCCLHATAVATVNEAWCAPAACRLASPLRAKAQAPPATLLREPGLLMIMCGEVSCLLCREHAGAHMGTCHTSQIGRTLLTPECLPLQSPAVPATLWATARHQLKPCAEGCTRLHTSPASLGSRAACGFWPTLGHHCAACLPALLLP